MVLYIKKLPRRTGKDTEMNENLRKVTALRVEKTIKALEKNNMEGYFVQSSDELIELIDGLIKDDEFMTSGGSMTLEETGVMKHLKMNYAEKFVDRADCTSPEESQTLMRRAFSADTYFASTNAVTENGELYNIDGLGNRTSAMIFGPKQVILVVGTNKIVADMAAAETRLAKIACPANTMRLNMKTPCAATGECGKCSSPDRICCAYVKLAQQRIKGRIKVIFVDGSYGF